MTKNATKFISPLVFETLTNNVCVIDQFSRTGNYEVEHVALAKMADIVLIAPATANVIAKLANGIADDALTTQVLACTCKKLVAPAMNTNMYLNPVTQDNLKKLERYGFTVITPASGLLACRDEGIGKLPEESLLADYVDREILKPHDLVGKKVVVTAGATRESIDPVRFITNHSSGKMGFSVAREYMLRGASVTLIAAANTQSKLNFVNTVSVESAEDMFNTVTKYAEDADIIIKAAAVADYTPTETAENKIKKKDGDMQIKLKRTKDILAYLGEHKKKNQFLCGFSMETENLVENSQKKLKKKNADMIVANNLKVDGAGFGVDTNVVTLITGSGVKELPIMSKEDVSAALADEIKRIQDNE